MADTTKTNPAQTEQQFNILPHPAKSNDPAHVEAGLAGDPAMMAHHAREPHLPKQEVLNKLEAPLSREELKKRSEELNK